MFVFFSQARDDQSTPTHGHSVNHHSTDQQPSSSSTLCGGGTPRRTANTTHGHGRDNRDGGAAASHFGTIKEDVENNKDGGGLKYIHPQQPKDALGSKTDESLAASDRLASPTLKPLVAEDLQDENTSVMTCDVQIEPRKLYTNQSTAPPPSQSQAASGGGLLRKKQHRHLGQKSFSPDRKNSLDRSKSSPPTEYSVPVNLPPRGSPSILQSYSSEPSMCVCSLLSYFHHHFLVHSLTVHIMIRIDWGQYSAAADRWVLYLNTYFFSCCCFSGAQ